MGQDSEAAAEFVATVRGDHAKMKEWYTGSAPAALRDKYGDYPSLWKEVLNWPGWKEARKEYLKHTQQNEQQSGGNGASGGDGGGDGGSIPRKRKSRWGSKSDNNDNNSGRGGSRFGPPPEKRPSIGGPPPLNIPGLGGPTNNLTPQQQDELARLQSQLRRVNERLDNLEREAARVDALPRGHRERSPSPPPSKLIFVFFSISEFDLYVAHSVFTHNNFSFPSFSFSVFEIQFTERTVNARTPVPSDGGNVTRRNDKICWKRLCVSVEAGNRPNFWSASASKRFLSPLRDIRPTILLDSLLDREVKHKRNWKPRRVVKLPFGDGDLSRKEPGDVAMGKLWKAITNHFTLWFQEIIREVRAISPFTLCYYIYYQSFEN